MGGAPSGQPIKGRRAAALQASAQATAATVPPATAAAVAAVPLAAGRATVAGDRPRTPIRVTGRHEGATAGWVAVGTTHRMTWEAAVAVSTRRDTSTVAAAVSTAAAGRPAVSTEAAVRGSAAVGEAAPAPPLAEPKIPPVVAARVPARPAAAVATAAKPVDPRPAGKALLVGRAAAADVAAPEVGAGAERKAGQTAVARATELVGHS